jgi:hypothetical protein
MGVGMNMSLLPLARIGISLAVVAGFGAVVGGVTSTATATATVTATAGVPATLGVGTANSMYPAFAKDVLRYAVRAEADGTLEVTVTGAERVWFNGAPSTSGSTTLTGLAAGDEVSVFIEDEGARRAYALFVLPELFPTLESTISGTTQPGLVALTLNGAGGTFENPPPVFETLVDRHGVPAQAHRAPTGTIDYKMSPHGAMTSQRPHQSGDKAAGFELVEFDDHHHEVKRRSTVGLQHSDNHDGLLMPDGSYWLTAYEPNKTTGLTDSVIQHISADDELLFQWSTAQYASESATPANPDYAHLNSIDIQENGDIVASFRHFHSVWRIATVARDGYEPGDVVWKLGGRDSSFTFAPGETGPCAQHTATVLPNGNVLMFDNGGLATGRTACINQDDPLGDLVDRPSTRIVEWALDESRGTATLVKTYGPQDRFSLWAGGAFRLDNGNVLMSWTPDRTSIANEVSADNEPVWELRDAEAVPDKRFLTYRAHLVPVRDRIEPVVSVTGPADGARFAHGSTVPVEFTCTDRGGSTLQTCDGPTRLNTSTAGIHTWTVTATDGFGNTTKVTRTYTVDPALITPPITPPITTPQVATPDVRVKLSRTTPWHGSDVLLPTTQIVRTRLPRVNRTGIITMQVVNRGTIPGRFLVRGPAKTARGAVRVSYLSGGAKRTKAVTGRGWRTPFLAPGEAVTVKVRVKVLRLSPVARTRVRLRASSETSRDAVQVTLRR